MVIAFKACPGCEGDVHSSGDQYGPYYHCLQCGYMTDRLPEAELVGSGAGLQTKTDAA